jgi:hypothetical protein
MAKFSGKHVTARFDEFSGERMTLPSAARDAHVQGILSP